MTGDQTAQLIAALLMLVLVGSSLLSRRLPLGAVARMTAGWLLIFGAVLVGYSYRVELHAVAQRVIGDLRGERGQTVGETLRVPLSEDGHFWVRAQVNGAEQRFLIDSGATTTALSVATANAAGVEVDVSGFPVMLNTANGTVEARRAVVERLRVGPIESRALGVVVSPAFRDTNVLGMNFLSSLESWRVEGNTLVLVPRKATGANGGNSV
jgi:aspartyl protease family protein